MSSGASVRADPEQLRREARRFLGGPVSLSDLSLEFDESTATSVEVHVEGRNFYPPMLEDIASAQSSVHINQFGFRPGVVGEAFAEALLAKATEGVPVRLVVDRQGSDPEGGSRELYERLTAGGIEVCVVRATKLRARTGALGIPTLEDGDVPAVVLHNAPGRSRPITKAITRLLEGAGETLDVVNPYVTDRRMIRRNWACAAAQRFHHAKLLDAVRILEYPTMLHAKAFVRDGEELLAGTCNLGAWSLKRFFEIDVLVRSEAVAAQFDERFSSPAETASAHGRPLEGVKAKAKAAAFAAISPLL